MTQFHDDSSKDVTPEDLLDIKIALAIDPPKAPSPCPTEMELAALIGGRLDKDRRNVLWGHLNACDRCYQTWLFATQSEESETSQQDSSRSKNRIFKFSAMAAAAMIACVLLYLYGPIFMQTNTETLLSSTYKNFLDQKHSFSNQSIEEMIPLPWQNTGQTYGFGDRTDNLPANLAFGAGLFTGRKRFADPDTTMVLPSFLSSAPYADGAASAWAETAYKDYYHLGQWCVLLVVACSWPDDILPKDFWEQQNDIAAEFQKAFQSKTDSGTHNHIANAGITQIREELAEIETTGKKRRIRKDISVKATKLIQLLSPE